MSLTQSAPPASYARARLPDFLTAAPTCPPSRNTRAGALVSIRLDASRNQLGKSSDNNAEMVFDEVAGKILRQIGYPTRHALVKGLLPMGATFPFSFLQLPVKIPLEAQRVMHALELFFEVAAEICREREARGIPRKDAAPVLLWDEVSGESGLVGAFACALNASFRSSAVDH